MNICTSELEKIKNTPEQRAIRAKKYMSEDKLNDAKLEFHGIVENFPGTQGSEVATLEIEKINKSIDDRKKEEERKKALGYKILKPSTTVKFGELTLNFEKIWKGIRWTFDDHGREYSY